MGPDLYYLTFSEDKGYIKWLGELLPIDPRAEIDTLVHS